MRSNTDNRITEEMIAALVHHFYEMVRNDTDLNPIFAARITDWNKHLHIMCDFWSSIVLKTARFNGQPMLKHQLIADRTRPEHFARWLELFDRAVEDIIPADLRMEFLEPATRIAQSLQMGMFQVPFNKKEVQQQLNLLEGRTNAA